MEKKGKKQKANLVREMLNGLTNYRVWLLAACYAYSFGVEVIPLSHVTAVLAGVYVWLTCYRCIYTYVTYILSLLVSVLVLPRPGHEALCDVFLVRVA